MRSLSRQRLPWADAGRNAVFLCRDRHRRPIGAEIAGTCPDLCRRTSKGLVKLRPRTIQDSVPAGGQPRPGQDSPLPVRKWGFRHSGRLTWPPRSPSFAWRNYCLIPPRLRSLGESLASLRGLLAARRSGPGAFTQAYFNVPESHYLKEGNPACLGQVDSSAANKYAAPATSGSTQPRRNAKVALLIPMAP